MSFRFWNKTENKEELPRPKGIPEAVGRDLVVKMRKDPDWVWSLKGVLKLQQADSKTRFDFRVFDERDAALKGVRVKNYKTLDEHPELILFDGWFDKKTSQVHVEEKNPAQFKKAS